ncbi:MAG: phospholipase D-like domain-containing protein [Thermodesulfobacteriota bacterium]
MKDIQILATGPAFIKEGIRGTEPVIEDLLRQAQNEIQIMAYLFSPNAKKILKLIEKALARGIKTTIIVNKLELHDERIKKHLSRLKDEFSHLKIIDFKDKKGGQLHAKVLVVDRKKAVLGSANFSWGGMTKNYEIGVLVEGQPAWKLAKLVDDLTY